MAGGGARLKARPLVYILAAEPKPALARQSLHSRWSALRSMGNPLLWRGCPGWCPV
ncbi:hypothetical protein HMPREF0972_00642 [Actinomyces sp. oral taxon 848 str. F0332]|nr:hypothetical protein HMPREF0972_00642 [Actinomyces sp. oral taxon 848 str. F0332]